MVGVGPLVLLGQHRCNEIGPGPGLSGQPDGESRGESNSVMVPGSLLSVRME